jgi:translation initiation factor IF-2
MANYPEKRSPVIVVMGHVDHGKTSLLDYIRKANVAAKEAGSITQSIGAYEIDRGGKKITFIDTPGHEAFSKMRARGAKVADVAILVVAADDSVQPQTKEAIKIIQDAKIPFVVAINKIDKANISIEKVKADLAQAGLFLEGYGGNTTWQGVSAKTGEGVNELLDLLLLSADLEDLSWNPKAPAKGFIIESRRDSKKGITAVAIVKNGVLKTGDFLIAGSAHGKVKSLEDFMGKKIKEAIPSSPVLILGLETLPAIGETITVGKAEDVKGSAQTRKPVTAQPIDEKTVRLILKADMTGSLEALNQVLKGTRLPERFKLEIMEESVGEITDGDIKMAIASHALIIGFNVEPNKAALSLAKNNEVQIITSEIIYDLIKKIEELALNLGRGMVKGDLEILAIFGKKGKAQIVGGKVIMGEIPNHANVKIKRGEQELGKGKIINTQSYKKDVQKILAGNEGGLLIESEALIQVGDHLIYS